jgi:hypothetical protein
MQSTNKIPGVWALLGSSLEFYKKHYKIFVGIGLVIIAVGVVEELIFIAIGGQSLASTHTVRIVISIIFGIISVVANLLMVYAVLKSIQKIDQGGQPKSVGEIFKEALHFFWPIAWICILSSLAFAGASLFLIVPGIIIGIYITFAVNALVLDGKRGLNSLLTSFHYVQENWWAVLWRKLGLCLVFAAIFFALVVVTSIIIMLVGGSFSEVHVWLKTIDPISNLVLSVLIWFLTICVFTPIVTHYEYSVFIALKGMKSEPDLTSPEAKTRRKWFIALVFVGIVVVALMTALAIIGEKYRRDHEKAVAAPQAAEYAKTQVQTLTAKNLDALEKVPVVSKELGVSIQPPKGWAGEYSERTGLTFHNPTFGEGEPPNAIELQYFSQDAHDDLNAQILFNQILAARPGIKKAIQSKAMIGGRLAYVLEGQADNGTIMAYLIPDNGGVYTIATGMTLTTTPQELQTILDSVTTFKIIE